MAQRHLPSRTSAAALLLIATCGACALAWDGVAPLVVSFAAAVAIAYCAGRDRTRAELRAMTGHLQLQGDVIERQRAAHATRCREHEAERERLRTGEDRLRFALRSARTIAWEWNLKTGECRSSEPLDVWLGLPPGTVQGLSGWLAVVHPDDRARCAVEIEAVRAGRGESASEYRVVGAGGAPVRAFSHLRTAARPDGSPSEWATGILADVTADRENGERLRLLESAVLHAHDGVVVLSADPSRDSGRSVLFVNDAFCRMTGYGREELVGRSLHLLRGPETDPATLEALRRSLEGGAPLQAELRNYRKDGSSFWVDLSLVPVPGRDGSAAHWVMVQREVTARRNAEEAVRRSEEWYRLLFESSPLPMWVFDRSTGQILAANDAAVRQYGYAADEFRDMYAADLDSADGPPAPKRARTAGGGAAWSGPSGLRRHRRKDGTPIDVEVSTHETTLDDRAVELVLAQDITERRRLEDRLRQAQKLEVIGQMAGGVAHDFNNVLTAALGNLALVKFAPDDPNRPLVRAAEKAATRAADLTRKLLGYARRNQVVSAPVEPQEALDEAANLLRRTLDPRVVLTVEVEPGCGAAFADATLLNQAVLNLCLNARDAMPEGGTLALAAGPANFEGPPPAARPNVRPGKYVRFSVRDTGCGIAEGAFARLFEPFFTTKPIGHGTGLGLAMVQGIVEQHGGWVECRSERGRGTTFDLFLPRADRSATPTTPPRPFHLALPTNPAPPESGVIATFRTSLPGSLAGGLAPAVLLVDDEAMIRDLGRLILEKAGYCVLTAEDGREAVGLFAREHRRVGLVLLDVTMPRMSGPEAFRELVRIDPAARIMFSTGYSADDIAELGGSLGLLSKPYRPHELLAAVRGAMDGAVPIAT